MSELACYVRGDVQPDSRVLLERQKKEIGSEDDKVSKSKTHLINGG